MNLTYAAPCVRDIAVHDGPIRHDAPAERMEAATGIGRRVVSANDVPKLDLAGLIPSEDLPTIAWQTRHSTTSAVVSLCLPKTFRGIEESKL